MKAENIRVVEINTTAFEEENFVLVTDLTDEQIEEVIRPIVLAERNATEDDDDTFYDNESLFGALQEEYPNSLLVYYTREYVETLEI